MNHNSPFRVARTLVFLVAAFIGLPLSAAAKSTDDVVILKNGDRMTGEIKSLEHGELTFKSAYMIDSVRLDWARVVRLESKDQYIVLLVNGHVFTAHIQLKSVAAPGRANFSLRSGASSLSVRPTDIVRIRPADQGFWKRLNGTIDFGLGYTSGDHQYQTQLAASAIYQGEGYEVSGDMSSTFSGQTDGGSTRRHTFDGQYRRLFGQRWFYGGIVDLLNSEEQSLDLRTSLGGFVGRKLIQTDHTSLSTFVGAVVSREHYSSANGRPTITSAESLLGLDFSTFRFRTLGISSRFLAWPSLTDPGRVRLRLDSNFRIELVKDLFWSLNLYENFDNRPPIHAKRNDLGISTSFGWKY